MTTELCQVAFDELERQWAALPAPKPEGGSVRLIVVRTGEGNHATPARVELSPDAGLIGDRWLANPKRGPDSHISFIDSRVARLLTAGVPEETLRWVNEKGWRSRRLRGVYAQILHAGVVALGDGVRVERV